MMIQNGLVLDGTFTFRKLDLVINETIESIYPSENAPRHLEKEVIDARGLLVLPGLFDIHTHGAVGVDAMDGNHFETWRKFMNQNGIINFLPTTISAPKEEIAVALTYLGQQEIEGIHLEGPFLCKNKKGAHHPDYISIPSYEEFRYQNEKSGGRIRVVTIAPDIEGALDFIQNAIADGVRISLGHTASDAQLARKVFDMGARQVTHILNAMDQIGHREPSLAGAALDDERVFCEVIADGIHLDAITVRLLYKMLGEDRMVLISDAISATGMQDGSYLLGGLEVEVKDRVARTKKDGSIAGSTFHLRDMVRSVIRMGLPMEKAIKMASLTPARAIGCDKMTGSIEVSKQADIFIANENLDVVYAIKKGEICYRASK